MASLAGQSGHSPRRPRSDGARSREAILKTATALATVEGIDGLSLGRLAEAVGMSKSGLFAHFGSKEELQLATIGAAREIFEREVVAPALAAPSALERLRGLCERFLVHVDEGVFPGGCFFASVAAELDTRPGPVRDLAIEIVAAWTRLLQRSIEEAQVEGTLDGAESPEQLAFELGSFLLLANAQLVAGDRNALGRARRAIDRRLDAARPVAA